MDAEEVSALEVRLLIRSYMVDIEASTCIRLYLRSRSQFMEDIQHDAQSDKDQGKIGHIDGCAGRYSRYAENLSRRSSCIAYRDNWTSCRKSGGQEKTS